MREVDKIALQYEINDGVVSGVEREVVVGEDGGVAALIRGVAVVGVAAEDADVCRLGGEGGAPDLGLGLRGRGQGQQRGGGQQGQAGPRATQQGSGVLTRRSQPASGNR